MSNEKKLGCVICDELSLAEFKKAFESGRFGICDGHAEFEYAQHYCIKCYCLIGIDPVILSLYTG